MGIMHRSIERQGRSIVRKLKFRRQSRRNGHSGRQSRPQKQRNYAVCEPRLSKYTMVSKLVLTQNCGVKTLKSGVKQRVLGALWLESGEK